MTRQLLMFATFAGMPALTVGLAWCRAHIIERAAMSTDGESRSGSREGR